MTTVHAHATGRSATGPDLAPLPADAHLLEPVMRWAGREPTRPVAAVRRGDEFVDVTAQDFYGRVRALAKGLIASGVTPGDRVVILSHTRLEWLLLDYAILAAGAVTVPIYETSSPSRSKWILSDSGAGAGRGRDTGHALDLRRGPRPGQRLPRGARDRRRWPRRAHGPRP